MTKFTTIFQKTLRDVRGSTIGIAILLIVMAILDLALYPSYSESLEGFEIPAAMSGLLGEAADLGMGSPEGFITAEYFSWIPLVLIILAVVGGTAAFAGEAGAGTMDLLLAQPIKRWQLALAKTLALVVAIAIAALAGMIGFVIGKALVDFDVTLGRLFAATVNMLPLTYLFLAASLLLSARMPSRGLAAMIMTGTIVIAYFLQVLGETAPALETARKISPFYWAEPSRVVLGGFDWTRSMLIMALATATASIAVWQFERRDVASGAQEWRIRDIGHLLARERSFHLPTLHRPQSQPE
jgi:ABC-2 type transport system permease protein